LKKEAKALKDVANEIEKENSTAEEMIKKTNRL
jgi:hypothetical protein